MIPVLARSGEAMLHRTASAASMTEMGQARSPQPDPKDLLARQMTPHITDAAASAARMITLCQEETHGSQQGAITSSARASMHHAARVPP
jgi:hypothetical protein